MTLFLNRRWVLGFVLTLSVLCPSVPASDLTSAIPDQTSRQDRIVDMASLSPFASEASEDIELFRQPVVNDQAKRMTGEFDGVESYRVGASDGAKCTDSIYLEIYADYCSNETSWSITYSGGGAVVASFDDYHLHGMYEHTICVDPDSCYDFNIYDSRGDGMCCVCQTGFFRVWYNGQMVDSGGQFDTAYHVFGIGNECESPVGKCCLGYGDDPYCLDTTVAACEEMGGFFDYSFEQSCATDECTLYGDVCYIPIVIEGSPFGFVDTRDLSLYNDDYGSYGKDVVYTFTLDEATTMEFSLCGSPDDFQSIIWLAEEGDCTGNDIAHEAYSGCGTSQAALVCEVDPGTYSLIIDGSSNPPNEGIYTLTINEFVQCELQQPVNAVLEGEPHCGVDYVDYFNGGCNIDPYSFSPYTCNDTVWGVTGTFPCGNDYCRETDWYKFELTKPMEVTCTAISNMPFWFVIMDAYVDNCRYYLEIGGERQDLPCDTVHLDMGVLQPGIYYAYVGAGKFDTWPCGSNYWFVVEAHDPTFPEIAVAPVAITEQTDQGGELYTTITVSNDGDDTLYYNILAEQGPTEFSKTETAAEPIGYLPADDKLLAADPDGYPDGVPYFAPRDKSDRTSDNFGYVCKDSDDPDGPIYDWIDISGVGTAVTPYDEYVYGPFDLGFDVPFYGESFSSVYFSSNGYATFTSDVNGFENEEIPSSIEPNGLLAAFWDDLDPESKGNIYYYADQANQRFIISYLIVPHYGYISSSLNFQIVINADGSFLFQYAQMYHSLDTPTATVGLENAAGTSGFQYEYNALPSNIHSDMAIEFAPPTFWLSADPTSGVILPGEGPDVIDVAISAQNLVAGTYNGNLAVSSNDLQKPMVAVPVVLYVGGTGTLEGVISDVNTGLPVADATVTMTFEQGSVITDTTDVNGSFSLEATPGSHEVSVAAGGYVSDSEVVSVTSDQVTTFDMDLNAPMVEIDETPVDDFLVPGYNRTYTVTIGNSGSAPLEYSVILDFNRFGNAVVEDARATEWNESAGDLNGFADAAPFIHSDYSLSSIKDFQDSVFARNLSYLGDEGLLGIEFDGTSFWITGSNSTYEPNVLYKLDRYGELQASYAQSSVSGFGWRDLAWDGEYLWGSEGDFIVEIDPNTGEATGNTISGPTTLCRGLAYDPDHDWFWTADFFTNIMAFDRNGTLQASFTSNLATYGLAWDDLTEGGPYLWVFSQDGPETMLLQVSQFDPTGGYYTGVSWTAGYAEEVVSAMAGGACFTTEWDPEIGALFLLGQGVPSDYILGYEISETIDWLRVVGDGSGLIAPGATANVELIADFTTPDILYNEIYEATLLLTNSGPYGTPEISFTITAGEACVPGELTHDELIDIADLTYLITYLFLQGGAPSPYAVCSGDVNCDCIVDIGDLTELITYLFLQGGMPCGMDDFGLNCGMPASGAVAGNNPVE